jgi:hypothetical protein
MTEATTMRRRLQQLVANGWEALGLWCLGLPRVPRPISGGFNLIEIPLKKSAIGGTSVTLVMPAYRPRRR